MIISTQNLQEEYIKEMKVKRTNNLHNLLIATELHTYEESAISWTLTFLVCTFKQLLKITANVIRFPDSQN